MTRTRRCKTGKTQFPGLDLAKLALRAIRATEAKKPEELRNTNMPTRAYRCEHCGRWHLTHQP